MSDLDRLVAELQQEIDAREAEIYSARVLQQARRWPIPPLDRLDVTFFG